MPLNLGRPVRFAPRAPRYATETQSCVLLADDREIIVTIKNFTHRGFMAIASEPIGDAAELGISIPGYGIVRADVRWIDGMEFGGAFTDELPATAMFEL